MAFLVVSSTKSCIWNNMSNLQQCVRVCVPLCMHVDMDMRGCMCACV